MGPATRMGRAEHSVHTGAECPLCRELRAAAVEAAVALGAHRIGLADVLERVPAPAGALERHGVTVEGLLVTAYREVQRDLFALADRAWRQPLPPAMRAAQGIAAVLGHLAARPQIARFRVIEARRGGPRLAACHDAAMRAYAELIMRRTRDDAPVRYELVTGAVSRVITERIEAGEIATLPDALDECIDAAAVFAPNLSPALAS